MKTLALALVAFASTQSLFAQSVQTASQIASSTFPSTVLLVMEDDSGQPLSLGSGFFVSDGIVATNFHVIEGASRGYARIVGQKTKFDITGSVGLDQEHDLVLLLLDGASAPSLGFGDSAKVAIGDTVFAVGNPEGLEGTFSQGIISGFRKVESNSLLQITAPISPGSSGGPVLDSQGKLIGVAVATYKEGQNLNFAIPASYLQNLLQTKGGAKPLSSATRKVTKSVIDEFGGNKITEGVSVASFRWSGGGMFSLSLLNKLRESVKNVYCLVIFYNGDGQPIDFAVVRYPDIIPAGLGKRIENMNVAVSTAVENNAYVGTPGRIDFRILGFEIESD